MPRTLEALQAEVMRLSPADRARLLDRLVASLDVDGSKPQKRQSISSSDFAGCLRKIAEARVTFGGASKWAGA